MSEVTVVVGGGIVGCAVTLELARLGRQPLLLEAGGIGSGVTGASLAGITRHLAGGPDEVSFVIESAQRWESLGREFKDELGIDIELDRCGHLALIESSADGETMAAIAQREAVVALERAEGLEVEMIKSADVKKLVPKLNPHSFKAASWCAGDSKVNALLACRAMLGAAVRAGASVRTGQRVLDLRSGWRLRTSNDEIRADSVVVAAGPWTPDVLALVGWEHSIAITPKRAQCCATERLDDLVEPIISSARANLETGYTQLHQTRHGEVLFNTVVESGVARLEANDEFDLGTDHHFLVRSARRLLELFPSLASTRVLRSWAGVEAWTPDRRFLIGQLPGHSGLFVAAGDSGLGFVRAPLIGRLVADLVAGRTPAFDLSPYAPGRPSATVS